MIMHVSMDDVVLLASCCHSGYYRCCVLAEEPTRHVFLQSSWNGYLKSLENSKSSNNDDRT